MLGSSLLRGEKILMSWLAREQSHRSLSAAFCGYIQQNDSFNNFNRYCSRHTKYNRKGICRSQNRCLASKPSWDGCGTLDDVVNFMTSKPVKKVVVMAGAGISTLSGIPDFRSPGTGLYDNLQKYDLPYPEAVFDINYFSSNPKPFYCLAKELYPSGNYRPNVCHYFVRLLYEKGILMRMLTQNIDGLERLAGIPSRVLVEAHGTFATATCRRCKKAYEGRDLEESIFKDEVPICAKCQGVIKPDLVFFGEQLPQSFHFACADMIGAELLIIMGTSLEVQPFASTAELVPEDVPRVLFNQEAAGPFATHPRSQDVLAKGNLKDTILEFCEKLGWKDELDTLISKSEKRRVKI